MTTDTYTPVLPPEFRSGNEIPVERATITRERMTEILTDALAYELDLLRDALAEKDAEIRSLKHELAAMRFRLQGVDMHHQEPIARAALQENKQSKRRIINEH